MVRRNLAILLTAWLLALLFQQGYFYPIPINAQAEGDIYLDVSRQAGVVDNRVQGTEKAAGQAWGDYDNDGWVDLYVTDPEGPNTLYHNNGDGTFSISPLASQVTLGQEYSAGATFADYDNDGWKDLYVTNWGPDRLFRNVEGQAFVDVTRQAGLGNPAHGRTASWGDYDQDGYLDLYVANWSCYPDCGRPSEGDLDVLYHNNGDGTFSDVTRLLGSRINGSGFVANFTDYDNDGDLDIYLVNDEFINPIGNKLWRNDGPGCGGWCFSEVAKEAKADEKLFGMGLASGDYDNDGDIDFYFSNAGPMVLLQNQGEGTFRDVAAEAGVDTPNSIAWGTVFLDYDNDGWRDLYLAVADTGNGKDIPANPLFRNNRDGTFTKVACAAGSADVHGSLGVAYADYDQDGWVDLVVGNMEEGYRLYRNQLGETSPASWLALELVGDGPVNRDAVGARVTVTTANGETQLQEVINGSSMGAGNELALYFGLGAAEKADVTVRWPDGVTQTYRNVPDNTRYQVFYPAGGAVPMKIIELGAAKGRAGSELGIDPEKLVYGLAFAAILVLALTVLRMVANRKLSSGRRVAWAVGGSLVVILTGAWLVTASGWKMPDWLLFDEDARLLRSMEEAGVEALENPEFSPELVNLGEALFWDPELSGNRDTSCATCHHSLLATGDGLSVSIGTGGVGLGDARSRDQRRDLIPRNAPPVFNLGYEEWTVFFWDGRVFSTPEGAFDTPASDRLPDGLDNLLAAQAMFPVTSRDEMRGRWGDKDIFEQKNELAMVPDWELTAIWDALMERLLAVPGYVELFTAAYPELSAEELGFQHAANALAAYQAVIFTFEDSPWDRYIRGEEGALTVEQKRGALLFYGEAGCADCHSGGLLTDQQFHNIAVPQLGDGKGREQPLDLGRARESGSDCDRFAFRTPPLRNVTLTGPWMHNGAYMNLEAAVRHHLDPQNGLKSYDPGQLVDELEGTCQESPEVIEAVLKYADPAPLDAALSDEQVADLLAFLDALTSPSSLDLSRTIPASVPSGLPVGGR